MFLPLEHKIHIFSPPCNILYIHAIAQLDSLTLIHWIVIYPVDSAVQLLNNWDQFKSIVRT